MSERKTTIKLNDTPKTLAEFHALGGLQRMANATERQRSRLGRKAANARWEKAKASAMPANAQ